MIVQSERICSGSAFAGGVQRRKSLSVKNELEAQTKVCHRKQDWKEKKFKTSGIMFESKLGIGWTPEQKIFLASAN